MQTVTFTCVNCNNLMAVEVESLGQAVQCPTCHQVVVAPAATPAPPAAEDDLSLEMPRVESHESIFSDEMHDEDLFGSRIPKVEMPPEPAPETTPPAEPLAPPSVNGSGHTKFADYPPNMAPANSTPAAEAVTPPATEAPVAPAPAADEAAPPAQLPESFWYKDAVHELADPPPRPVAPEPEAAPPPPSWVATTKFPDVEAETHAELPVAAVRQPRPAGSSSLLATVLVPYAILVTVVAVYYMWRVHGSPAESSALETFPDAIRIIDHPISPKNKGSVLLPEPDAPLPKHLHVPLGGTIQVGDLDVTPVRVEQGRLKLFSVAKDGKLAGPKTTPDALTLHLRIRNRSEQLNIYPTDPMYDRLYDPEFSTARPYTLLQVGKDTFYGGAIDVYNPKAKREYIAGQDNDDQPLGPGEERQTVVCTNPWDEKVLAGVLETKGPMTWRVQLRKGQVHYRRQEVPVCTVIGVQFTAADIQKPVRN